MADLLAILTNGANGLSAHRAVAQTAAHNLQNVNTEGYSRQRVDLEAMPAEFVRTNAYAGLGVGIGGITQSRDAFIERQMPTALGAQAQHSAESESLRSVVGLDPESGSGLTATLGQFYADLRALSQNPSQPGLRAAVVGAARSLTATFNRTAEGIENARKGVDGRIQASVDEANQLAQKMASLNAQVVKARASGAEPNDLLDERRNTSDRLAELLGGQTIPDGEGNLNVALPGGFVIVSGTRAATLSTAADTTNGGHLVVQVTRVGATTPQTLATANLGGEVRGALDARDGTMLQTLQSLDTLAFEFASALNTQHQAGFALDGSAGQAFFQVGATSTGAAASLAVNPNLVNDPSLIAAAGSATTTPGDASNLFALINTERQPLASGASPSDGLASIIATFGSRTRAADARAQQEKAIMTNLQTLRESASGVSIDEEMIELTRAQRAFDAVSRVITTADEMLQTLMSLK